MRKSNKVTARSLMGCDDGENKFVDLTCIPSISPTLICSIRYVADISLIHVFFFKGKNL